MTENRKDEKVIEIELNWIETPKGNVATVESVEQIANVILLLDDEINAIREKVDKISAVGGLNVEELDERLKRIESMIADLDDKISIVVDALQELAKSIAELKKKT